MVKLSSLLLTGNTSMKAACSPWILRFSGVTFNCRNSAMDDFCMSSSSGSGIMDGIREKDTFSKLILPRGGLLHFDSGAGFSEFLLHLFGLRFINALFDRLRSAFHKVLGFFQTETRKFAHHFNDRDLVRASGS